VRWPHYRPATSRGADRLLTASRHADCVFASTPTLSTNLGRDRAPVGGQSGQDCWQRAELTSRKAETTQGIGPGIAAFRCRNTKPAIALMISLVRSQAIDEQLLDYRERPEAAGMRHSVDQGN